MKKPIEVKKKLKKVTEYTACFAFLMFLQGVGAPMVFADATAAINAKFEILWNLISAVVQSVGGVILLWHAFEFGASMQAQEGGGAITRSLKGVGGALVMLVDCSVSDRKLRRDFSLFEVCKQKWKARS